MGANNREIELKLRIKGNPLPFSSVVELVERAIGSICTGSIDGNSFDVYWHAPISSKVDFVRLRATEAPAGRFDSGHLGSESLKGPGQMTIKSSDRGDNLDRVEVDLEVGDTRQAQVLLGHLLGDAAGLIWKLYKVFFIGDGGPHGDNISVYEVHGSSLNHAPGLSSHVYIEVEAGSRSRLADIVEALRLGLPGVELDVVKTSLYELYVWGEPIKLDPLSPTLSEIFKKGRVRRKKIAKKAGDSE